MSRPSEPLLALLRGLLDKKSLTVSVLAGTTGIKRTALKKILSGKEDMTVDQLLAISDALEMSPSDFGLAMPAEAAPAPAAPPTPGVVIFNDLDAEKACLLVQAGFGVGCDFMFVCDVDDLEHSNVPPDTLAQYAGKQLPIKLERAYHQYNEPKWTPDEITVTLSFDALYACTFRFAAMKQMIFWPLPIDAPVEQPDQPTDKKGGAPFLRLLE